MTTILTPCPKPSAFAGVFFFQAEDGIRAFHVTGVQTCALPICSDPPLGTAPLTITMGQADEKYDVAGFYSVERDPRDPTPYRWTGPTALVRVPWTASLAQNGGTLRSEERRVGKEWRASGTPEQH